jgi:hypothetical protein
MPEKVDDEGPVLERMHHKFTTLNGLRLAGKHHDISVSDAHPIPPTWLRTIDRQPVDPARLTTTVGLAYATPFSGNTRVTIALVGLTIAYIVADRMKFSQYRESLREDLDADTEHESDAENHSA